ncbi:MAG: FKBP-type peptidyl-prolyl cis-trans isomerase [Desulfomonile tiedjei]|uniref:Peptidyl-prolyl cis-trans isomerase n=1 Tax=Desulfomonile tiedjei TaxID=2358 RepID=A0A9D6V255_9BACT|nr:FKBP-type peptidyl-prolyl cis-trans isomerase [Desulfomonile tiedjei]
MSESSSEYRIGDKSYVKIKYRVRVAQGRVIKGAHEPELLDFVTGFRQVIPGLEDRLQGHSVSEKLSFTVPAEEAFGPRYQELVVEKNRSDFHFPAGMKPYTGMEIPVITGSDCGPETAVIRKIDEDTIVIDCNHPLAGAALEYDLEIVEARPARDNEICSEWDDEKSGSECACSSPCEIILGREGNDHN